MQYTLPILLILFFGIVQYNFPQKKLQINQQIVSSKKSNAPTSSETTPFYPRPLLQKFCLPNLVYPQSSLLFQDNTKFLMESEKDILSVADWYTNQLQSQSYSLTNNVQNSTNNNNIILLMGEKNNQYVFISLNNTQEKTSIFLELNHC